MKILASFFVSVLCGLALSFCLASFSVFVVIAAVQAAQRLESLQPTDTKCLTVQPRLILSHSQELSPSMTVPPSISESRAQTRLKSSGMKPVVPCSSSGTMVQIYSARSAARGFQTSVLPVSILPPETRVPEQWTATNKRRKKNGRSLTPRYR